MLLSPQFDIKLVFCFKPTTIKMKIKQFKKKKTNQTKTNSKLLITMLKKHFVSFDFGTHLIFQKSTHTVFIFQTNFLLDLFLSLDYYYLFFFSIFQKTQKHTLVKS